MTECPENTDLEPDGPARPGALGARLRVLGGRSHLRGERLQFGA